MKKLAAFTLALALSAALTTTAFAAETSNEITDKSNPQTANVTVTTKIAPTYTVTIPANTTVKFNDENTSFGEIKLTAAQLDPDKSVKVALSASGTLKNSKDNRETLAYQIQDGTTAFTSATYKTAGQSTALTIHIAQDDWNAAFAGDYADTVTFTISYQ